MRGAKKTWWAHGVLKLFTVCHKHNVAHQFKYLTLRFCLLWSKIKKYCLLLIKDLINYRSSGMIVVDFFSLLLWRPAVCVCQCLLVLERLSVWLSGGEELCAWNKDFQLQCHRQNHSDTGEKTPMDETINSTPLTAFCTQTHWFCSLFWHFAGITALVELPKNSVAAAMDKEIGMKQILMTRLLVTIW